MLYSLFCTTVTFNEEYFLVDPLLGFPIPCLLDPPLKSFQLLHCLNPLSRQCCAQFSPVGTRSRWSTDKYIALICQTKGLPSVGISHFSARRASIICSI